MFPKEITLNNFVYDTPSFFIPNPRLKQEKDNVYTGTLLVITQAVGAVFIQGENAYKVLSVEHKIKEVKEIITYPISQRGRCIVRKFPHILVTIEEYTDDKVKKILSQFKKIRENLSVCADIVEESGSLKIASELRERINNLKTEDLD